MNLVRALKKARTTVRIVRTKTGLIREITYCPGKLRDAVITVESYNPLATVPAMPPLAGWRGFLNK